MGGGILFSRFIRFSSSHTEGDRGDPFFNLALENVVGIECVFVTNNVDPHPLVGWILVLDDDVLFSAIRGEWFST